MTKVTDKANLGEFNNLSDAEVKEALIKKHESTELKKTNFPTEEIDLPSKGLFYPEDNILSSGKIEMKYMTAREEDILTSANLIKRGIALDRLFKALIVSPINYNDLLVSDKDAIMISARILAYGKEYPAEVICPQCSKNTKVVIDLTTIKDKVFDTTNITKGKNEFTFKLPASKKDITFKLLTHQDELNIEAELKSMRKSNDEVDHELSTRLKYIITSIDGNPDRDHIREYVEHHFYSIDSKALRTYMRTVTPGPDMTFDFKCSNDECGHEVAAMRFHPNVDFFWPDSGV